MTLVHVATNGRPVRGGGIYWLPGDDVLAALDRLAATDPGAVALRHGALYRVHYSDGTTTEYRRVS